MHDQPVIQASSTQYPDEVDAFVAHILSATEDAWGDTEWLYTFFVDCFSELPMTIAISESYLEDWIFRDSVLADETEVTNTAAISDSQRIEFALDKLSYISRELIDDAPTLVPAVVIDTSGREVVVVMSALPAGQAGVVVEYYALESVSDMSFPGTETQGGTPAPGNGCHG